MYTIAWLVILISVQSGFLINAMCDKGIINTQDSDAVDCVPDDRTVIDPIESLVLDFEELMNSAFIIQEYLQISFNSLVSLANKINEKKENRAAPLTLSKCTCMKMFITCKIINFIKEMRLLVSIKRDLRQIEKRLRNQGLFINGENIQSLWLIGKNINVLKEQYENANFEKTLVELHEYMNNL